MKTATIDQYHVFGTRNSHGVTVIYRGCVLWRTIANQSNSVQLLGAALRFCEGAGFTHWRRFDNVGGVRRVEVQA